VSAHPESFFIEAAVQRNVIDTRQSMVIEDLPGHVKGAEVRTRKRAKHGLATFAVAKRPGQNDQKNREDQNRDLANVTLIQTRCEETPPQRSPRGR
jgi:hypothetical protein